MLLKKTTPTGYPHLETDKSQQKLLSKALNDSLKKIWHAGNSVGYVFY
jgi:hypothetical protein